MGWLGVGPGGTVGGRERVRDEQRGGAGMTAELSEGRRQPSGALDELTWIAADTRRSVSVLSLQAAGTGPARNAFDAGTRRYLGVGTGYPRVETLPDT